MSGHKLEDAELDVNADYRQMQLLNIRQAWDVRNLGGCFSTTKSLMLEVRNDTAWLAAKVFPLEMLFV